MEDLKQFETALGTMYYELYFDEVRLYDSDKSYINHDSVDSYLKDNETEIDDETIGQRVIEHYKDIRVEDYSFLILGEPIMYAESLKELLKCWNKYCKEAQAKEEEFYEPYAPYTMEDFKNNIQYNRIGKIWFIIYYTEY